MRLQEALTESFYAWEKRGRGWSLADEPVQLEPPHRPFFILPEYEEQCLRRRDDGRIDPFWKRLFARKSEQTEVPLFEEAQPFARGVPYDPVTFTLYIPSGHSSGYGETAALLRVLSGALDTISFELVGTGGAVRCAVTCAQIDREHVRASLGAFLPQSAIVEDGDPILDCWQVEQHRAFVDFGLQDEFFLPIQRFKSFSLDPYSLLTAALSRAAIDECVCVQVLFERAHNPWDRTVIDALTDDEDGKCFFDDTPEFLQLAKQKTESPLFAVSLRIGAAAGAPERTEALLHGLDGVFDQYSAANSLIPLDAITYAPGEDEFLLLERQSIRTGMLLSLDELIGLVHIPSGSVGDLLRERPRTPPQDGDGILIGHSDHYGTDIPVTQETEDRFAHTHVIGGSGTGKSSLLLAMIQQDMANNDGFTVIDPHGDLVDDILACVPEYRRDDVILFDPSDTEYPIGLNVLRADTIHEKTLLASDLVTTIARLSTSWGDVMSTVLSEAVLALLEADTPYSILDLRRFLTDNHFRYACLAHTDDEQIQHFWRHDFTRIGTKSIGPLVTRLDSFLRSKVVRNIIGQRDGGIHVGDVMRQGKILLARLPLGLMGTENSRLLGSLLVTKCQQYALARQAVPKRQRRPFYLYLDECQHFVTPSLASIFSEGRKYRLGLILSHQYTSQLTRVPEVADAALGNAHTRIVFRTSGSDAGTLTRNFSRYGQSDIASLGRGEALVRMGNLGNEAHIWTPRVEVPESIDDGIRQMSREQFGVPREDVEAKFKDWYRPPPKERATSTEAPPSEAEPTRGIETTVVAPIQADIRQESAEPAQRPVPKLLHEDDVPEQAPEKKPAKEGAPELPELGRGGTEHKYIQHLVKRLAEERGCRVVIEEALTDGRADVALYRGKTKVACEISVTTDLDHELQNITKCTGAGVFTHIVFVSQKARMRERMNAALDKQKTKIPTLITPPEKVHEVLDSLFEPEVPKARSVKGYKVKVKRGSGAPESGRIAEIIARSIKRDNKK